MAEDLTLYTKGGRVGRVGMSYTDDNDFVEVVEGDCVRNSPKTIVNSSGALEEIPDDFPPVSYENGESLLLLEDVAENTCLNSRPTANEGSAGGITYEVVDVPYFGGNTNVVRYGDNTSLRFRYYGDAPIGTTYGSAFYVLMDDGSEPVVGVNNAVGIDFYLRVGGALYDLSSIIITPIPSTNWYRIFVIGRPAAVANRTGILKGTNGSAKGFIATQFDLTNTTSPSSPIHTTGSALIREDDNITNIGRAELFNSDGLVIDIDIQAHTNGGEYRVFGVFGDVSNFAEISYLVNANETFFSIFAGGVSVYSFTIAGINQTDRRRLQFKVKTGDIGVKVDGVEVDSSTASFSFATPLAVKSYAAYNGSLNMFAKIWSEETKKDITSY